MSVAVAQPVKALLVRVMPVVLVALLDGVVGAEAAQLVPARMEMLLVVLALVAMVVRAIKLVLRLLELWVLVVGGLGVGAGRIIRTPRLEPPFVEAVSVLRLRPVQARLVLQTLEVVVVGAMAVVAVAATAAPAFWLSRIQLH